MKKFLLLWLSVNILVPTLGYAKFEKYAECYSKLTDKLPYSDTLKLENSGHFLEIRQFGNVIYKLARTTFQKCNPAAFLTRVPNRQTYFKISDSLTNSTDYFSLVAAARSDGDFEYRLFNLSKIEKNSLKEKDFVELKCNEINEKESYTELQALMKSKIIHLEFDFKWKEAVSTLPFTKKPNKEVYLAALKACENPEDRIIDRYVESARRSIIGSQSKPRSSDADGAPAKK